MPKKLSIQDVRDYLTNYSDGSCTLLSTDYVNTKTPLLFRCNICGKEFQRDFEHLKRGKGRFTCESCAFEKRIQPNQGTIEDVKIYIEKNDTKHECTLISTEYVNNITPLVLKCNVCGEYFTRDFNHIKRNRFRCSACGIHAGALHQPKNGISIISTTIRPAIRKWREKILLEHPYCDITGESEQLQVHHLNINFSDILQEAYNNLHIQDITKLQIKECSHDVIEAFREEVVKLHFEKVEGVVLTKKIHQLFHSTYGYYNNTKEQYYEFKNNLRKDKLYGTCNYNSTDDSAK